MELWKGVENTLETPYRTVRLLLEAKVSYEDELSRVYCKD